MMDPLHVAALVGGMLASAFTIAVAVSVKLHQLGEEIRRLRGHLEAEKPPQIRIAAADRRGPVSSTTVVR